MHRLQDDHRATEEEFIRIWCVLSFICQVHLWVERNAAVSVGRSLVQVEVRRDAGKVVHDSRKRLLYVKIGRRLLQSEASVSTHVSNYSVKTLNGTRLHGASVTTSRRPWRLCPGLVPFIHLAHVNMKKKTIMKLLLHR